MYQIPTTKEAETSPWTFNFWENCMGVNVIERDFLADLEKMDSLLHKNLFVRMDRVTHYPLINQSKAGNLESLGDGLFEFKFHLKDEIRFIGHISYEGSVTTFHVFCAFKKKDNKIRLKHIRLGQKRYEEFKLVRARS